MAEPTPSPCLALQNTQHLSSSISLWIPSSTTCNHHATQSTISSSSTPPIIILFAWLAAPIHHLRRHVLHYHNVHPTAHVYIVSNGVSDFFWRSRAVQAEAMRPLVEAVGKRTAEDIMAVQLFSNGGNYSFTTFAALYHRVRGQTVPFPDLVLDSSPGTSDFGSALAAFDRAMPQIWYLRFPLYIISFLIISVFGVMKALGSKDEVTRAREALNSPEILGKGIARRRLYVFGTKDDLVRSGDVVEHAAEAKQRGGEVGMVEFEGSGHVGHLRRNGGRYWREIDEFWAGSGMINM